MTDMLFEKNEFNKAGKWISSTVTTSKETDLVKRLEELLSKDHSKPMLEIGIEQVLGKLEFIAKYYKHDPSPPAGGLLIYPLIISFFIL